MPTLQRGMCVAAVLLAAAMDTQCQQVKHTHDRTREQIVQGLMKLSDEELHRRNQRLRKEHTKAVLDRNQTQEQSLQELIQLGKEEPGSQVGSLPTGNQRSGTQECPLTSGRRGTGSQSCSRVAAYRRCRNKIRLPKSGGQLRGGIGQGLCRPGYCRLRCLAELPKQTPAHYR